MIRDDIRTRTGVILAGGQSRRFGGGDKFLFDVAGETLIARVVAAIAPQVGALVISANGDPERLSAFGLPVLPDRELERHGPLAGFATALAWTAENRPQSSMITVPADTPFLPGDLVVRLDAVTAASSAGTAIAMSGGRAHPVIGLWPLSAAAYIDAALAGGDRKLRHVARSLDVATADFPMRNVAGRLVDPFFNINTPSELDEARRLAAILDARRYGVPVIGIAGWKKSGKTTLACRLIAALVERGLRVASVKHTHHGITADAPQTDSARHEAAGSIATIVVGPWGWARGSDVQCGPEPLLSDIIARLPAVDLVVIEGYKSARVPKIEVRGTVAGREPLLADRDGRVVAIASALPVLGSLPPHFHRNDTSAIAARVCDALGLN